MYEFSLSAKTITPILQINIKGVKRKFYTDFQVYKSIFHHILTNAIKFSGQNSTITISVELNEIKNYEGFADGKNRESDDSNQEL